MNTSKQQGGFTLIELLVVISIIGLLSTFAIISLDNARKKSRNAKRVADMKQIQMALSLYADNHGGKYPTTMHNKACLGIPSTEVCWGGFTGNDSLNLEFAPYLSQIPKDPEYGKRNYGTYLYESPGMYHLPTGGIATGDYILAFAPDDDPSANASLCLGWSLGV